MFSKLTALVTSGFGIGSGIKWVLKARKVLGYFKSFYKEGKDVLVEVNDVRPVATELWEEAKKVKFGNKSDKNIAQLETVCRLAVQLVKETNDVVDEVDDIIELTAKVKAAL